MTSNEQSIVNLSRKEEWNSCFSKAKALFEKNGHLTTSDKTLSNWITYQRHHSKNLSQRQIELLESIHYKTAGGYRKKDVIAWRQKIEHLNNIKKEQRDFSNLPIALKRWIYKQRDKARKDFYDYIDTIMSS